VRRNPPMQEAERSCSCCCCLFMYLCPCMFMYVHVRPCTSICTSHVLRTAEAKQTRITGYSVVCWLQSDIKSHGMQRWWHTSRLFFPRSPSDAQAHSHRQGQIVVAWPVHPRIRAPRTVQQTMRTRHNPVHSHSSHLNHSTRAHSTTLTNPLESRRRMTVGPPLPLFPD
jgi:hypothetical protein